MFRSPSILALMKWHAENQSDGEGGDGLVRHPCNSKAWKHFHKNVDPTFQRDARNVHFALAADHVSIIVTKPEMWSQLMQLLDYDFFPLPALDPVLRRICSW
jgi:hypothetical protein